MAIFDPAVTRPTFAVRKAGTVRWARPLWRSRDSATSRARNARAAGLRYEAKVIKKLEERYDNFWPHLQFSFDGSASRGTAIPDGLFFFPNRLVILEIKLKHSADAWHQLTQLYLPIVQASFPRKHISLLEVTRFYDPSVVLPGSSILVEDLDFFLREPRSILGVYSWRL